MGEGPGLVGFRGDLIEDQAAGFVDADAALDQILVALLVERVDIGTEDLKVRLRMDGLLVLAREITADAGAAA